MCRGVDHGGRRCPSDTSAARTARRANRRVIQSLAGSGDVVKPRGEDKPAVVSEVVEETRWGNGITEDQIFNREAMDPQRAAVVSAARVEALRDAHRETEALRGGETISAADGARYLPGVREAGALVDAEARYRLGESFAEEEASIVSRYAYLSDELCDILEKVQKANMDTFQALTAARKEMNGFIRAEEAKIKEAEDSGDMDLAKQLGEELDAELPRYQMTTSRLSKEANDAYGEYTKMYDEYQAFMDKLAEEKNANTIVYADAIQSVIGDIRSMGSPDGNLNADKAAQKPSTKVIEGIQQYYPSTWWENSNKSTPIVYVSTRGRAHYRHNSYAERKMKLPYCRSDDISFVDPNEDPLVDKDYLNSENVIHLTYKPGDKEYDAMAQLYYRGSPPPEGDESFGKDPIHVLAAPEFHILEDGPVKGRGWKKVLDDEGNLKYYKRPRIVTRALMSESVSELTISGSDDAEKRRCALHEISHRFEHTNRNIGRLENAFYHSRTTNENGEREELKPYALGKKGEEFVRDDDFLNVYMGKDYQMKRGDDYPSYEILSMGMESVFGGMQGGLRGLHQGGKKDTDMRDFIIGLLTNA